MSTRNLDALLRPRRVVVLGEPVGATAQALSAHLQRGRIDVSTVLAAEAIADGELPLLAVVADPARATPDQIRLLGQRGCGALIWPHGETPGVERLAAAGANTLRVLGPRSPGVLHPALGLEAAALPAEVLPGTLALIVQSHSVAAAAVDWAAGRQIGFSWAAVTGAEADVDVADLLDFAAMDPVTRAVVLQLGHVRSSRKFMSAARACARVKPVAVLQTQPGDAQLVGPDPVRSAAFARAGLIECRSLPELFDAIAALERLPAQARARVLVTANGSGICALGLDAMRRQGLTMAKLPEATWQRVRQHLPGARWMADAIDLGEAPVDATIAALGELLADDALDLLLYVRSPVGDTAHEVIAQRLLQLPRRERLLTVWLGLQSALPARRRCAEGRIATFTSPDAAARAVRHRRDYTRNRELLTRTPPRDPALELDVAAVGDQLQVLVDDGQFSCEPGRAAAVLAAYGVRGLRSARGDSLQIDVDVRRHAELGLYLRAAPVDGRSRVRDDNIGVGLGFPPLDPLLAMRILADAGIAEAAVGETAAVDSAAVPVPSEDLRAMAQALGRIAQLVMDQPAIADLSLRLVARRGEASWLRGRGRLDLTPHPLPPRERLMLAPYPSGLTHTLRVAGRRYRVRAVRPSDEPAVIDLLESLDPEAVRMRFFAYIRHFSHAMAARMTQIDYDRELALVIVPDHAPDRIVSLATLVADADGSRAEFAVLVHGEHVGRGLGRHLLQQFVEHARRTGIGVVFGETLAENVAMQTVARQLGFRCRPVKDDPGCIEMELRIG